MTIKDDASGRWPLPGGTTPVPNALLDVLLPTLSDTQLRVLLVVARSTLGWKEGSGRKGRDWLSHRQLQRRTGRSGAPISQAIDALVQRGLLLVQNEAGQPLRSAATRRAARSKLFFCLGPGVLGKSTALPYPSRGYGPAPLSPKSHLQRCEPDSSATLESQGSNDDKEPSSLGVAVPAPELPGEGSTLERRLHFPKTTKETGTKYLKNESSLLSEVKSQNGHANAEPWEETGTEAELQRFLTLFDAARHQALPGEATSPLTQSQAALLRDYFVRGHGDALATWLPTFFSSSFGYARRRHYSLGAYLDCFFILRAKRGARPPQSCDLGLRA